MNDAQVRPSDREGQGPRIVEVVADVGVDDYRSGAAAAAQVARARRAAVQDFQATMLVVHCGVHVWRSVLTHGVCAHHSDTTLVEHHV